LNFLLKVAISLLATFVLLGGAILLFAARPTPVVGVNGGALLHSIDRGESDDKCRETPDGDWACRITGNEALVGYLVDVGWDGCWDASHESGPIDSYTPRELSGCIDIWDHLQLEDVLNGD
jgi:hypothetical protein